jgi:sulfide:quinone oxidoreductase
VSVGTQRDGDFSVLIAGGGVAALEAAMTFAQIAPHRIAVTLLAPEPHFWYRPAAVAEPFGLGTVTHVELAKLAEAARATFVLGALGAVDRSQQKAYTRDGTEFEYEALLIACGATARPALEGALTFRGPGDVERFGLLLEEIDTGVARRIVFAVPWGAAWVLPAYELALMTATWAAARHLTEVEVAIVTPEEEPLQLFGKVASDTVQDLLDERGITIHLRASAQVFRDGELLLADGGRVIADRAVALPRLYGERINGIPHTIDGFIPVDRHCRVSGMDNVFAAGDITDYPVTQGGIASEQARAAAEAIAALAGEDIVPAEFHPVLRGMLLTGGKPHYLRRDLVDESSWATASPIWWPPTKVVGRHLAPLIASIVQGADLSTPPDTDAVQVEIDLGELESPDVQRLAVRRFIPTSGPDYREERGGRTVADVMQADPITAAPEDTLGELAERMRERDFGSALVTEYGHVIGILTSRDLLRALAARTHSSDARVRQWMTADPVTVARDASLGEAAQLMTEYRIHHLPVVDGGRPVGIVGMRDVSSR